MKIAIMQPYFFPYIGYWQLINCSNVFVIYDDVNFIKKGYVNRNEILINNAPHLLTLPLINASQNKLINQIEISDHPEKLLKKIEMAYKKALYFESAFPVFENILTQKENNLAKYLGYSIEKILTHLELNTKLIYSSQLNKNNLLKGQDKIIAICKILAADEYINAIGGASLYDKKNFEDNGVILRFLKSNTQKYKQFFHSFTPNLSIIDVLMFNSKGEIKEMLSQYSFL